MFQQLRVLAAYTALLVVLSISMPFFHFADTSYLVADVTQDAADAEDVRPTGTQTDISELPVIRLQDQKNYEELKKNHPLQVGSGGKDGQGSKQGAWVKFNVCIPKLTEWGHSAEVSVDKDGNLVNDGSGAKAHCSVNSLEEYLNIVYRYLIYFGGIGGTLMIVLGGFQVMISGYNEDLASKGISKIWQAILGMIFLLSISFILNSINPDVFKLELEIEQDPVRKEEQVLNNTTHTKELDEAPFLGSATSSGVASTGTSSGNPSAAGSGAGTSVSGGSSSGARSSNTSPSGASQGSTSGTSSGLSFSDAVNIGLGNSNPSEASVVSRGGPTTIPLTRPSSSQETLSRQRSSGNVSSPTALAPRTTPLSTSTSGGASVPSITLPVINSSNDGSSLEALDISVNDSLSQIASSGNTGAKDSPQDFDLRKVDTSVVLSRETSGAQLSVSDPRELSIMVLGSNPSLLESDVKEQGAVDLSVSSQDIDLYEGVARTSQAVLSQSSAQPVDTSLEKIDRDFASLQKQIGYNSPLNSQVQAGVLPEYAADGSLLELPVIQPESQYDQLQVLDIHMNDSTALIQQNTIEQKEASPVDTSLSQRNSDSALQKQDSFYESLHSAPQDIALMESSRSDSLLNSPSTLQNDFVVSQQSPVVFDVTDSVNRVEQDEVAKKEEPRDFDLEQPEDRSELQREDSLYEQPVAQVQQVDLGSVSRNHNTLAFGGLDNSLSIDHEMQSQDLDLNDSVQQLAQNDSSVKNSPQDTSASYRSSGDTLSRQNSTPQNSLIQPQDTSLFGFQKDIASLNSPDAIGDSSVGISHQPQSIEYDLGGDYSVEGVGSRRESTDDHNRQIIGDENVLYVIKNPDIDCSRNNEQIDSAVRYAACLSYVYGYTSAVNSPLFIDVYEGMEVEYENVNFDMLCRLGQQFTNAVCSSLDIVDDVSGVAGCQMRSGFCRESDGHIAYRNGEFVLPEGGSDLDQPMLLSLPTLDDTQKYFSYVFSVADATFVKKDVFDGQSFLLYKTKDPMIGSYDIMVAHIYEGDRLSSEQVKFDSYVRETIYHSNGSTSVKLNSI